VHKWFLSISRLAEASLFSIAPDGPYRDAVVLDTIRRNARTLSQAELDNGGKLYSAFFLSRCGVPEVRDIFSGGPLASGDRQCD